MIYLSYICILLLCSSYFDFGRPHYKTRQFAYLIICSLFVLLAGLRYMNGADTENYYQIFKFSPYIDSLHSSDFSVQAIQPGFVIFVAFCKTIINNFTFQLLVEAFFVNTVIFIFINKYSPFPFLTVLVYFILNYLEFNMEIMRECLAVAFGLLAFMSYDNKRNILAIFCCLLAFFFIIFFFFFFNFILFLNFT